MKDQNYSNHMRLVPGFHFFVLPLAGFMLVWSAIKLYRHYSLGFGLGLPFLCLLASLLIILTALYARSFALKAQDRAIRAEENLRHYAITGSLFDKRLKTAQIIALRFAPDAEFASLAKEAAEKDLSQKDIKKAIQNWKADRDRV